MLLALLVAGCSSTPQNLSRSLPEAQAPAATVRTYVALGDSFTAAPYVPSTAFADGCLRSNGNYPALVADDLGARLRDVSCSGAATADMTSGQQAAGRPEWYGKQKPQLDALRPSTDLVTVGIGGNDEQLFTTLVQGCTSVADQGGSPCAALLRSSYGDPASVLREVGARVTRVLRAVGRAAPDAVVVLVGYPRLVDPDDPCDAIPIAPGDLPLVARLETRLNQTLARSASQAHAAYVDMHALSAGHEICSDDPWVNGRTTDESRALAFHPFAAEQQAVADAVLELLRT